MLVQRHSDPALFLAIGLMRRRLENFRKMGLRALKSDLGPVLVFFLEELYVLYYFHEPWAPYVSQGPRYLHICCFFKGLGKALGLGNKETKGTHTKRPSYL